MSKKKKRTRRKDPKEREPQRVPMSYRPANLTQSLGHAAEECGELLAAIGKSIRFGINSSNPELPQGTGEMNWEWVLREWADARRAMDTLGTFISMEATPRIVRCRREEQ